MQHGTDGACPSAPPCLSKRGFWVALRFHVCENDRILPRQARDKHLRSHLQSNKRRNKAADDFERTDKFLPVHEPIPVLRGNAVVCVKN
jgi:hypothetical protein